VSLLIGNVRNSFYNERTHFLYRVSDSTLRSLCGAVELLESVLYASEYANCPVCLGEDMSDTDVKVSGMEPELSTEEYMVIFNRVVNEGEELGYHLPAVKDLSPEELVDHVNLLAKFATRIRVAKQAAKITLEQKRINLNKEQRDALKLRDMQYKPKPVPKEGEEPRKPRKAGTAKPQDAVEMMMSVLGISREKAEKKLLKLAAIESLKED